MKRFISLSFIILLMFACGSKPVKINWVSSLNETVKIAEKNKQNILVFFYTGWSKWCQILEDSSLNNSKFANLKDRLIFTKLNAELNRDVILKYKVSDFPTLILLTSKGEEIDRIVGYYSSKEIVKKINNYLKGKETLADYEKKVKEDSLNVVSNFRLGEKFQERGQWTEAEKFYNQTLKLDPKNSKSKSDSALFNLAIIQIKNNDFDKALEKLDQLKKQFPKSSMLVSAELYRAFCYAKKGDKSKAIGLYESFLKQYPNYPHSTRISEELQKLKS
ncbi:MAG: hypothetical protein A2145_07270 [candidate division Zixibacteria bacterium RBG_16_40_9]|nr:MAG: hypothetical protein A2145_07270 [candidate division Zixibacteria bacterium RBG_16_40_9]